MFLQYLRYVGFLVHYGRAKVFIGRYYNEFCSVLVL